MNGAPAVHDSGSGPPLLLLHAYPLDASQWDHQVASLSGGRRCLRYDLWGFGASPAPPDAARTLDDFAAAVLSDLETRGIDRVDVVGMSMGGYVALALWRAAQPRLRSMVLCSTRATADTEAARADRVTVAERALREDSTEFVADTMVDRLLGPGSRGEPHVIDPVRGRIRRSTPAGIAFAQRAMAARRDSTGLLHAIDVPTLVVTGAEDALIAVDEQRAMAVAIPEARHLEMQCGHLPNLELPYEFNDVLEEHLAAVR